MKIVIVRESVSCENVRTVSVHKTENLTLIYDSNTDIFELIIDSLGYKSSNNVSFIKKVVIDGVCFSDMKELFEFAENGFVKKEEKKE